MKNDYPELDHLLTSTNFTFGRGFTERLMGRIMKQGQKQATAFALTASISRLFYWVCAPGLAAAVVLLALILLSGKPGTPDYRHRYASSFTELLNDYYYESFKQP